MNPRCKKNEEKAKTERRPSHAKIRVSLDSMDIIMDIKGTDITKINRVNNSPFEWKDMDIKVVAGA